MPMQGCHKDTRTPTTTGHKCFFRKTDRPPRLVPAFTIQALQQNVKPIPPPRVHLKKPRPYQPTLFRRRYDENDVPFCRDCNRSASLKWKEPLESMDYHMVLPLFFEGLREVEFPYTHFVQQGIKEMIKKCPDKVLPVLPQLILPLKKALETRIPNVVCSTLKTIQRIVRFVDLAGEALVPYYRQLLPMMNVLKDINVNIGDNIDYSQQNEDNVGDLVQQTLEILEQHGGVDAFINIKYMIPTYESCIAG